MANQRTTFLKRQREADRNDKAKAKERRLEQARQQRSSTGTKGPQIAWDEAVTETESVPDAPAGPGDVVGTVTPTKKSDT